MKLFIKNMVCPRCITSVEQILSDQRISYKHVMLGEVDLEETLIEQTLTELSEALEKVGFELLDDAKSQMIDRIKTLLIQKVQEGEIEPHFSLNKYLSGQLFREYSSISKFFPEVEGITIEQYFILQKIEKVKELLIYNEQPLGDIALNLCYSSTQHLSTQFKRLTGMTPTQFKSMGAAHRKSIDDLAG
ncbi:MAG: AraC family transcriptional regulator [Ginsengibacter sp.]